MARNKLLHEHLRSEPLALLQQILHTQQEHLAAWCTSLRLLHSIPCKSFLLGKYHRMTFDIAVCPSFSMCVAILFHLNGDILHAWTQRSLATDPLIGEAEAALMALSKVSNLKLSSLLFQDD
ncbi:hypothetical protein CJ030_MR5G010221 [Morella rubra]|uniref:RNase H type-1 domain-containing protein n=1 Tax=Morella rubra TaxID=262757 RepID=A0A6A1VJA2_9ROSI|nr:hypothetical protein CJ030_MR5G010221 [Morella rubra]